MEHDSVGSPGICRGCRSPVLWVKTAAGKNHPLNAKPVPIDIGLPTTQASSGLWVVDDDGVMRRATDDDVRDRDVYSSHFGTCPKSSQFRKGRS